VRIYVYKRLCVRVCTRERELPISFDLYQYILVCICIFLTCAYICIYTSVRECVYARKRDIFIIRSVSIYSGVYINILWCVYALFGHVHIHLYICLCVRVCTQESELPISFDLYQYIIACTSIMLWCVYALFCHVCIHVYTHLCVRVCISKRELFISFDLCQNIMVYISIYYGVYMHYFVVCVYMFINVCVRVYVCEKESYLYNSICINIFWCVYQYIMVCICIVWSCTYMRLYVRVCMREKELSISFDLQQNTMVFISIYYGVYMHYWLLFVMCI